MYQSYPGDSSTVADLSVRATGLKEEAFVSGADTMIDTVIAAKGLNHEVPDLVPRDVCECIAKTACEGVPELAASLL